MNNMIKGVKAKFNEVIEYSQNIYMPQTDRLLNQWYENKKHFIDKWGGLTKEFPNVTMEINQEDKYEAMVDFGCSCRNKIGDADVDWFICHQGRDAFFENRVEKEYTTKQGKKVSKGMKISRALKFFTEDKALLDEIQTDMSKIIQDTKFTGTMVMSVHPLDFLSSSENNHSWRSCHALDGEYRAGNLSFMADKHTFVCYVKSEKDSILPHFPFAWNSKKWRVLMHATEDTKVFMASKQYPFENKDLLNVLFDELISKTYQDDWNADWLKPPIILVETMVEDSLGSMHFNDCLFSSSYRPVIRYSIDLQQENLHEELLEKKMYFGDGVECLKCGNNMISLSETMLCSDCGDYGHCDCCGEGLAPEDIYELNGECLCERCFDSNSSYCDSCDTTIDTREKEVCWDDINDEYYCQDCYDRIVAERYHEELDEESVEGLL